MKTFPMKCTVRAAAGATRVDIYDDIGPGGFFSDGLTAKDFSAQLADASGPLDVHINSGGGDVGDGLTIASAIRGYRGFKRTIVDGIAASIASVIFQAGDERVVEPGGMVMIHDPFTMAVGNAAELRKLADDLDKHGENLAEQYARRAGGTPEQWRDVMRAETWYKADEAVAAGLADRIGAGPAELPAGFDAAVFDVVPGRIAAALRSLPVAHAPVVVNADGNHGPMTGRHAHSHPAYGSQGGDAMHSHEHTHGDGGTPDANHGHGHEAAPEDRWHAAAGKPFEPAPYHRDPDECVECPQCHLFNDSDARFCDQCGCKLVGRDDVRALPGPAAAARGGAPRNAAGDEDLGDGWVRGADGKVRFDPDGDGDDDSTPEGDTDHDYFAPDGTPLKPVPPCPVARDALTEERVRAILREEVQAAAARTVLAAMPADVKSKFTADLKSQPVHEIGAAIHRLAEWSASGHYPAGMTHADIQWMYGQCTAELKRRNPDSEAGGNLPAKGALDGRVFACHFLVEATTATAAAAGKSGGASGHTHEGISGMDLEQIRTALKGARA